jgi:peptidoglycan/LPS O-acetylase OafA/YrhL
MVVCFHGGWTWMRGGYVGVSVFFTLSGFLITRLLLNEHEANGRIALGSFWARRVRRLLPASTVCLAAVAVLAHFHVFADVPHLRRDLAGSVFQVQNWVQLHAGTSYAALVAKAVSPVDHFWSLAIEEQFYWLWPITMIAVLRRRRPAVVITGLAVAFSALAPIIALRFGGSAAYLSTPARVGEILIGAALAAWLCQRNSPLPPATRWLGPPALGAIVLAAVTWPSASGPAYRGLLPLLALATAALLAALQVPSPLCSALSWAPLVKLGAISYGVYLVHWPIVVAVRTMSAGRSVQFLITVIASLALATLSYVVLEQPIRRRRGSARLVAACGLATVAATFTIGQIVVPVAAADRFEGAPRIDGLSPNPQASPDTRPLLVSTTVKPPATSEATTATTTPSVGDIALEGIPVPTRPVNMLILGDSTAWVLGDGLGEWAAAHTGIASVNLAVTPGCGFLLTGAIPGTEAASWVARCDKLLNTSLPESLTNIRPDVVVILATFNDVQPRKWNDDEGPLTPLDTRYRERLVARYREAAAQLFALGVPHVVWIKAPADRAAAGQVRAPTDPASVAVLHSVIDEVAAGERDRITALDVEAWTKQSGFAADDSTRPDGMHWSKPAARTLSERFVGPAVLQAVLGRI